MTERDKALRQIQEYDFAMTEVNLFLDNHPEDAQALAYYQRYRTLSENSTREYEEKYGPLTMAGVCSDTFWDWVRTPWPWEC